MAILRIFRIVQTKDDARDDVLEFSRVPYSDSKQKRASAREGKIEAEEGVGGGALASINI